MTENKLIRDFTKEEIQSLVDHLNSTGADQDYQTQLDKENNRLKSVIWETERNLSIAAYETELLKKEVIHFMRLAADYERIIKDQQDEIDLLKS